MDPIVCVVSFVRRIKAVGCPKGRDKWLAIITSFSTMKYFLTRRSRETVLCLEVLDEDFCFSLQNIRPYIPRLCVRPGLSTYSKLSGRLSRGLHRWNKNLVGRVEISDIRGPAHAVSGLTHSVRYPREASQGRRPGTRPWTHPQRHP